MAAIHESQTAAFAPQGESFMIMEYTGRHTSVTPKLRTIAELGMERVALVANRCRSVHFILTEDKYRKIAEVRVQCRNDSLVATCESTEMETALRDALQKVELQAIRHKERYATVRDRPRALPAYN